MNIQKIIEEINKTITPQMTTEEAVKIIFERETKVIPEEIHEEIIKGIVSKLKEAPAD